MHTWIKQLTAPREPHDLGLALLQLLLQALDEPLRVRVQVLHQLAAVALQVLLHRLVCGAWGAVGGSVGRSIGVGGCVRGARQGRHGRPPRIIQPAQPKQPTQASKPHARTLRVGRHLGGRRRRRRLLAVCHSCLLPVVGVVCVCVKSADLVKNGGGLYRPNFLGECAASASIDPPAAGASRAKQQRGRPGRDWVQSAARHCVRAGDQAKRGTHTPSSIIHHQQK